MSENEPILVPKGRRTKQIIQPNELVECIKVILRDTERDGKFAFRTFGKTIYKPKKLFAVNPAAYKKKLGMAGVMTKEDFENGAFKDYGIDPEKVKGYTLQEQQAKKLAEMEAKMAELEAALAEKSNQVEPKQPKPVKNETTETK